MNRLHAALALCAAGLALGAALVDAGSPATVPRTAPAPAASVDYISALDLAERISRGDPMLRVIDVRAASEYAQFHVPTAVNVTLRDLADTAFARGDTLVIYADDDHRAVEAWMLVRMAGHAHVLVLREGLYEWIARVHEPRLAIDATSEERAEFDRAAALSRFFGGFPREQVARADVQTGYWTSGGAGSRPRRGAADAVAAIRRRGC